MSKTNDGGPAFPFEEKHTDGTHFHAHGGMTLRDWFAGMAMQAMVTTRGTEEFVDYEYLTIEAYDYADHMLRAREFE